MENKIVEFDNGINRYRTVAENHAEKGEYAEALGYLFTALEKGFSLDTVMDIADTYADAGLYELSNKYWFMFLDKAPEEEKSTAYEELGINFFYLDNIWLSGYYFHKKVERDGFIAQESLDPAITESFSKDIDKRSCYKIAYPFERADYKKELKEAKTLLVNGDFKGAIKKYESIPEGSPEYREAQYQLSVTLFVVGEVDDAILINRGLLQEEESLSVLCNLSSMYSFQEIEDSSSYYYRKALKIEEKDLEDYYKIATCAIEQGDHKTAVKKLKHILEENEYDVNMRFLYGVALLNLKRYDEAKDQFLFLYKINPENTVAKYYLSFTETLKTGKEKADRYLPVSYLNELPLKAEKKAEKLIADYAALPLGELLAQRKSEDFYDLLKWGIKHGGEKTNRLSVYVLMLASEKDKKSDEILRGVLLDPETSPAIKEMTLFALIIGGERRPTGVLKGNYYVKVKPRKLAYKDKGFPTIFYAYAKCLSRLVFSPVEDYSKIATAADKFALKAADKIGEEYPREAIAAFIATLCDFKELNGEKKIRKMFGANAEEFNKIKEIYYGDNND